MISALLERIERLDALLLEHQHQTIVRVVQLLSVPALSSPCVLHIDYLFVTFEFVF